MRTQTINETLPNGLPLYKLMRYKVTKEQYRIVKVNPEVFDKETGKLIIPLSVFIKIFRMINGTSGFIIIESVSQYDLEVWNERMNPSRIVKYRTRKGQFRDVVYANKD